MLPFSLPDKVLSHTMHYTSKNTQLHLTATTIATCITTIIIIIIIIRMNETLMPYHNNEASNTKSTFGLTTTLTFDLLT